MSAFNMYLEFLAELGDDERGAYFRQILESYPLDEGVPYRKVRLRDDSSLFLMLWAPNGATMAHNHGPDSHARIRVLRGRLQEQTFRIGESRGDVEQIDAHDFSEGEEIFDEPGVVHQVKSPSLTESAISLHEFMAGFKMKVYLFNANGGRGLCWDVKGDAETYGSPPPDAVSIWPD